MVTIKTNLIFDKAFGEALNKLSSITLDSISDTISLAKVIKHIKEEATLIFKVRDDMFNNYGVTGWDGNIPQMEDKSKTPELFSKVDELFNKDIELPINNKFKTSDSMAKLLSANDLMALEPILEY